MIFTSMYLCILTSEYKNILCIVSFDEYYNKSFFFIVNQIVVDLALNFFFSHSIHAENDFQEWNKNNKKENKFATLFASERERLWLMAAVLFYWTIEKLCNIHNKVKTKKKMYITCRVVLHSPNQFISASQCIRYCPFHLNVYVVCYYVKASRKIVNWRVHTYLFDLLSFLFLLLHFIYAFYSTIIVFIHCYLSVLLN